MVVLVLWLGRALCQPVANAIVRSRWAQTTGVVTAASLCWLLTVIVFVQPAEAGYEWLGAAQGKFAGAGTEGDLGFGSGVAVNYSTGNVYIADGYNNRVTVFNSSGAFLGAWGWDVTATGPDKAGIDQVETVTVSATGGAFTLEYKGDSTQEINFGATSEVVEDALNGLESVKTDGKTVRQGGKVAVTGGPGNETGSKPYVLTYEGALGDQEQETISPKNVSLIGGSPTPSVSSGLVTEGAPAFEDCFLASGDICREKGISNNGEGVGAFSVPEDVAVDQSTGDVYVLSVSRSKNIVQIFTPEGKFVAGFGELGGFEESASTDPERIQNPTGITVDSAGDVYISATPGPSEALRKEGRVMVFRPETAGDYEHYVYTGRSHDLLVGEQVNGVALDAAGDVFVVGGESHVYRFAPVNLSSLIWEPNPGCISRPESKPYAGLQGLTVNPTTGDVFIYSNVAKKFYMLDSSACAQSKTITQTAEFQPPVAKENEINRLAVNPGLGLEVEDGVFRPAGTLYALDPIVPLSTGLIFGQSLSFPPKIISESVSNIGSQFATLEAQIDPQSNATHYTFQYSLKPITECSVGHDCEEAPVGGGSFEEAGGADLVAAATVSLLPHTTYHFRVVASSHCVPTEPAQICESTGADQEFLTFPPVVGLPDNRAYEMVSPSNKSGGEVFPGDPFVVNCLECLPGTANEHFPMQSTASGDSIVYEGNAFSPSGDAVNENEYLSNRSTSGGWEISPDLSSAMASRGEAQGYKAVSPDLSHAVLYQIEPALSQDALETDGVPYANLYLQNTETPANITPLLTRGSVDDVTLHRESGRGPDKLFLRFAGASLDFNHIIFEANDALNAEAPIVSPAENNLYEWFDGKLSLINVLPNGTPEPNATFGAGNNLGSEDPDYSNAISVNGSRIFWTSQQTHRVYVHEKGINVEVPDPGQFLTASSDGSTVLLTDGELYNLESTELTDLTDKQGGFQGILGASKDLSTVYFVDTAVLTGGEENAEKVKAKTSEDNLYMWQNGVTTFITALDAADNVTNIAGFIYDSGDWLPSPADRTAQASADGQYLAFMANGDLTGYDNEAASGECGDSLGTACFEIYTYDSNANRLLCASCNPTGGRPVGPSTLSLIKPGSGVLQQPASVSANGRVFFNSLDRLSPLDKNSGVQNVYEYEPSNVGTCAGSGGCVFLISSGTGEAGSEFVNATPSGGDIFFTTGSQLVPQDQDDLIDLYDAREPHVPGEQVSFVPESTPRECASAGECRGPVTSPPVNLGAPLSAMLTGGGNLTSPPPPPVVKPPPAPTRAQLLAKALKACQKQHSRKSRAACAVRARKRYATKAKIKAAVSEGSRRGTRTAKK